MEPRPDIFRNKLLEAGSDVRLRSMLGPSFQRFLAGEVAEPVRRQSTDTAEYGPKPAGTSASCGCQTDPVEKKFDPLDVFYNTINSGPSAREITARVRAECAGEHKKALEHALQTLTSEHKLAITSLTSVLSAERQARTSEREHFNNEKSIMEEERRRVKVLEDTYKERFDALRENERRVTDKLANLRPTEELLEKRSAELCAAKEALASATDQLAASTAESERLRGECQRRDALLRKYEKLKTKMTSKIYALEEALRMYEGLLRRAKALPEGASVVREHGLPPPSRSQRGAPAKAPVDAVYTSPAPYLYMDGCSGPSLYYEKASDASSMISASIDEGSCMGNLSMSLVEHDKGSAQASVQDHGVFAAKQALSSSQLNDNVQQILALRTAIAQLSVGNISGKQTDLIVELGGRLAALVDGNPGLMCIASNAVVPAPAGVLDMYGAVASQQYVSQAVPYNAQYSTLPRFPTAQSPDVWRQQWNGMVASQTQQRDLGGQVSYLHDNRSEDSSIPPVVDMTMSPAGCSPLRQGAAAQAINLVPQRLTQAEIDTFPKFSDPSPARAQPPFSLSTTDDKNGHGEPQAPSVPERPKPVAPMSVRPFNQSHISTSSSSGHTAGPVESGSSEDHGRSSGIPLTASSSSFSQRKAGKPALSDPFPSDDSRQDSNSMSPEHADSTLAKAPVNSDFFTNMDAPSIGLNLEAGTVPKSPGGAGLPREKRFPSETPDKPPSSQYSMTYDEFDDGMSARSKAKSTTAPSEGNAGYNTQDFDTFDDSLNKISLDTSMSPEGRAIIGEPAAPRNLNGTRAYTSPLAKVNGEAVTVTRETANAVRKPSGNGITDYPNNRQQMGNSEVTVSAAKKSDVSNVSSQHNNISFGQMFDTGPVEVEFGLF